MIILKKENSLAIKMRKQGFSLSEISQKVKISKSTASLWLREVEVSEEGKDRIKNKVLAANIKTNRTKKNKIEKSTKKIKESIKELKNISFNKDLSKIICSLLFWCEGEKSESRLCFINSDPSLIKLYLSLLRKGFLINETKFRVCLHLHDYHNIEKQISFWSKITNIPISQFNKPYIKPHTGIRKRKNYPGCVSIRYYDVKLARELSFIAKQTLNNQ
jgi:predicted transcriptional regulator with HTH domain